MLEANGRVIMVTGANRGIGLATAKTLAARGYTLSLGARNPADIPLDEIGTECFIHHWDAEQLDSSAVWVSQTVERFGHIHGIVLNAGVELGGALETGTEEEIDQMFQVNFKGPLWLTRAALPHLRKAGNGRVINVASLAGKRVLRSELLGYSASKFAALSLTQAVRQAGWDDGVRATSVCPGLVETRMTDHVSAPDGQFKLEPETIAETIAYALSLPNSAVVAEILVNSRYEPMF